MCFVELYQKLPKTLLYLRTEQHFATLLLYSTLLEHREKGDYILLYSSTHFVQNVCFKRIWIYLGTFATGRDLAHVVTFYATWCLVHVHLTVPGRHLVSMSHGAWWGPLSPLTINQPSILVIFVCKRLIVNLFLFVRCFRLPLGAKH